MGIGDIWGDPYSRGFDLARESNMASRAAANEGNQLQPSTIQEELRGLDLGGGDAIGDHLRNFMLDLKRKQGLSTEEIGTLLLRMASGNTQGGPGGYYSEHQKAVAKEALRRALGIQNTPSPRYGEPPAGTPRMPYT